ncbi:MAG: DinB family protein [Thermoanaerobaculia bacterium]|jgi:uncharacterized damage-inducible protein DinB|nr:DinB family protein [Thermoanaerobaculia bacterium]
MEVLPPVVAANLHCLEQALELLGRLPESAFARTPERHARTVGPHLRHVLDHYSAFLAGLPAFRVDYDARAREPRLESDLEFAAARMREIVGELVLVDEDLMELPIQIRLESGGSTGPGGPDADHWSHSTVRRELQFLLSHTVHHFALISILLERFAIAVPEDFGIAPSTLKYWQAQGSCAPLPG